MQQSNIIQYPVAKRDENFKDERGNNDPYRWLENPDSTEVQQWVKNQNKVTQHYLTQSLDREKIKQKLQEIYNYEKYQNFFKRGNNYYFQKNDGLQNQFVLYTQKSIADEPEVFFDPNILSADGTTTLGYFQFSVDGNYFAYGLKNGGTDWTTAYILDVKNSKKLEDKLEFIKFSSYAWTHDNKGFFYNCFEKPKNIDTTEGLKAGTETQSSQNQKVYYHKLGTKQEQDILIYQSHSKEIFRYEISNDGQYFILYTNWGTGYNNKLYFADLKDFSSNYELNFVKLVDNFDHMYQYISNFDNIFYFQSNFEANKNNVIKIDIKKPDQKNWQVIIKEDKGVLSQVFAVNNNQILTIYQEDVHDVLKIFELQTGKFIYEIPTPTLGNVQIYPPLKNQEEIFYSFTSFLYPNTIYKYKFKDNENTVFKQPNIKGFDPNEYETKQVFYENKKDKTKIPMFITSKKGSVQNGPKPLLLYGYGGFNIPMNPNFDPFRIVMIKNLGINYAVANIRGGGEYGQQWHKEGMFENKQNVFDDFQFAAEYLIENKYTTSNQLGIFGRSNGGLLVGACVNQRPDLFKAGLAQVAVLDMLRFHKFTTGFAACADYGNPDNEEDYKYIVKYSPYHNINKNNKPYPALLFTTGDHDDRVVPLHSYKYISALQHELGSKEYQKQPILIRVDEMAGHGEGKPTQKLLDEYVDMYTFLSLSLNSPFQD